MRTYHQQADQFELIRSQYVAIFRLAALDIKIAKGYESKEEADAGLKNEMPFYRRTIVNFMFE